LVVHTLKSPFWSICSLSCRVCRCSLRWACRGRCRVACSGGSPPDAACGPLRDRPETLHLVGHCAQGGPSGRCHVVPRPGTARCIHSIGSRPERPHQREPSEWSVDAAWQRGFSFEPGSVATVTTVCFTASIFCVVNPYLTAPDIPPRMDGGIGCGSFRGIGAYQCYAARRSCEVYGSWAGVLAGSSVSRRGRAGRESSSIGCPVWPVTADVIPQLQPWMPGRWRGEGPVDGGGSGAGAGRAA